MAVGRTCLLAFVGGVGAVQLLPDVSVTALAELAVSPRDAAVAVPAAVLLVLAALLRRRLRTHRSAPVSYVQVACERRHSRKTLVWILAFALSGVVYAVIRAEHRLSDALATDNEDKVTRVVLRVAELPRLGAESRLFVADVLSSIPEGVPTRIQVRWNSDVYSGPYGPRLGKPPAEFPDIVPGQVWRMALVLRRPHGARNPHGFDYEGHVFAQGIRATGTVRGSPILLGDDPWAGLSVAAQRARHIVREAMLPYLSELRWGGVLLALAIGDQASVGPNDWLTFNRAGLTHLVSISGSHVTLIAVFAGMAVNAGWRRLRWRGRALAERCPAPLAAAWAALLVAWLYCLLAGWGVPARRTFVMLAVLAASLHVRVPLRPTQVLAVAAFAVVLMDPWALLASGFWLSFLAVYVLMAGTGWWSAPGGPGKSRLTGRWLAAAYKATKLQLAITFALLPVLAMLFSEVSLVSPLANAYAIPVIGALVTPLALLLAGVALIPGAEWAAGWVATIAHWLLQACMWPTGWLAALPGASLPVAAAPWWMSAFAMLGVGIALLPAGLPYRGVAWAFMLPALAWIPPRPAPGDWVLHALDVGQGSAVVVQTASRVLVFDTGPRYAIDADAVQRVVLPYLRSQGVRRVDVLVVSHGDMDHVGGLRSLLEGLPVEQAYSSFPIEPWLQRESRVMAERQEDPIEDGYTLPHARVPCAYGATWRSDEVAFQFLWPLEDHHIDLQAGSRERNRRSCVLRIIGAHHSIILPGDIGAEEEASLVARGLGESDVVLAAHHGSRHSSGREFVVALQARHVIAQAARWNRYGHPAEAVRSRWRADGAEFWETGLHGAVSVRSAAGTLSIETRRQEKPRYWSAR